MTDDSEEKHHFGAASVIAGWVFLLIFLSMSTGHFWNSLCGETGSQCIPYQSESPLYVWLGSLIFLVAAGIRPLFLTPLIVFQVIAFKSFGIWAGSALLSLASIISTVVVFALPRYFANKTIFSWMGHNLPDTFRLVQSKDYLVILLSRSLPFIPFDITSRLLSLMPTKLSKVLVITFIFSFIESLVIGLLYLFFSGDGGVFLTAAKITTISAVISFLILLPIILFEIFGNRGVNSLRRRFKLTFEELKREISRTNSFSESLVHINVGIEQNSKDVELPPVVLLYGFFSSRKCIAQLYSALRKSGRSVIVVDQGGFFGVLNVSEIKKVAQTVAEKLTEISKEYNVTEFDIVGHSKGGLVAVYLALFSGNQLPIKIRRIVTMGSPFKGTKMAYLALLSPFATLWRDVWQMRPNSAFLRSLSNLDNKVGCQIFCLYSENDRVVRPDSAVFTPRSSSEKVTARKTEFSHFEYLSSPVSAKFIDELLRSE